MNQGVQLKEFFYLSNASGAICWNHKVLLFCVSDSHYDADLLNLVNAKFDHIYILKSGYIDSDCPNENGPNASQKDFKNRNKGDQPEISATKIFTQPHIIIVIVEDWDE